MRLSDGTNLRTWTTGTPSARPPVVLLHGGPGLWDYLEPVAKMLDDLTVVHRYDQRGCGGSDPSNDQTTARLVADLEELRRFWGHDRIVVIGHSFGATLALLYAAAHPDRVARVVYFSGVGVGDWRTQYYEERRRRMSPEQADRLAELSRHPTRSWPEEQEFRALSWFTDHADRARAWQWATEDAAVQHPINFPANKAITGETHTWAPDHLATLAAALPMPVTYLHGTDDPRPATAVQALAAATPNAEVHLVRGAGHHVWREKPAELRQLLRALIA